MLNETQINHFKGEGYLTVSGLLPAASLQAGACGPLEGGCDRVAAALR